MTITLVLRDGPVSSVQADDAVELLWTLQMLGVHRTMDTAEWVETNEWLASMLFVGDEEAQAGDGA